MYWDIAKDLFENKESQGCGNSIVENASKNIKSDLPTKEEIELATTQVIRNEVNSDK